MRALEVFCALFTFAAAVLVYLNTLPAAFAFDDSFAVIYNGDVTNNANPLTGLLRNDFWGQRIRSEQSHKSYRPLTVLSFRLTRQLWQALPSAWTQPVTSWRLVMNQSFNADPEEARKGRQQAEGLDPLLFHAMNVLLHGIASVLVCRLAYFMFRQRAKALALHRLAPEPGPWGAAARGAGAGGGMKVGSGVVDAGELEDEEHSLELTQVHAPSWLASLAFALHPVHTEAVAGVVGQAEVLCAIFSVLALLTYFAAVDGRGAARAARGGGGRRLGLLLHWAQVLAAVALSWAAALSKEIGITVLGSMVCYDLLLAPGTEAAEAAAAGPGPGARRSQGAGAASVSGPGAASPPAPPAGRHWLLELALQRRWSRLLVLCCAGALYIYTRSLVAGDQLVRIYRKVENPIAFLPSALARALSTVHLHSLYAGLLLWPRRLSADWSFECIAPVQAASDPRNAAGAALYLAGAAVVLAARPWALPAEWLPGAAPAAPHVRLRRWRAAVVLGFVAAPFLPTSNILFYVGTYIGERLMYMPSIGFSLLLGEALAAALGLGLDQPPAAATASHTHPAATPAPPPEASPAIPAPGRSAKAGGATPTPSPPSAGASGPRAPRRAPWLRRAARWSRPPLLAACLVLLALYAQRTYRRNWDWLSEETLFLSAQKVCWRSAKVQLNSGILERRRRDLPAALEHFKLAREIEPGYCEPDYWVGITLINMGHAGPGLKELEAALSCKYVAQEALRALNTIYQVMQQSDPTSGAPLMQWGRLMLRPELQRLHEGCTTLEAAALGFAQAMDGAAAARAVDTCLDALGEVPAAQAAGVVTSSPTPGAGAGATPALAAAAAATLRSCVSARRPAYVALGTYGVRSRQVRLAAYQYLRQVERGMAACRSDGSSLSEGGKPTAHMQLIHSIQAVDAEDPWLQIEWGETMLQQGRVREGALHLSVGAMLLARAGGASAGIGPKGGGLVEQPAVLSLKGERLSAFSALEAGAAAYERAAQLGASGISDITPCEMRLRSADARISALGVPAAAAGVAGTAGAEGGSKVRRQTMAKQLLQGLEAIDALPECRSQKQLVETLRQRFAAWQQQQAKQ